MSGIIYTEFSVTTALQLLRYFMFLHLILVALLPE